MALARPGGGGCGGVGIEFIGNLIDSGGSNFFGTTESPIKNSRAVGLVKY